MSEAIRAASASSTYSSMASSSSSTGASTSSEQKADSKSASSAGGAGAAAAESKETESPFKKHLPEKLYAALENAGIFKKKDLTITIPFGYFKLTSQDTVCNDNACDQLHKDYCVSIETGTTIEARELPVGQLTQRAASFKNRLLIGCAQTVITASHSTKKAIRPVNEAQGRKLTAGTAQSWIEEIQATSNFL